MDTTDENDVSDTLMEIFMMKKENFVTLVMSTIGGLIFALGMCMALLPEWDAFKPGFVMGIIGR